MYHLLLVGCGGFCGSILRYILGVSLAPTVVTGIQYQTLFVNILGSFLIGTLLGFAEGKFADGFYLFLVPGFLGGFTTFSAFSGETFSLLRNYQFKEALLYMGLTLLGGLLFTALGYWLCRSLFRRTF